MRQKPSRRAQLWLIICQEGQLALFPLVSYIYERQAILCYSIELLSANLKIYLSSLRVIRGGHHISLGEGRKYFMEKDFETCYKFTVISAAFREFDHFPEFPIGIKVLWLS